jgi:DNA-binding LytR/AlgR family response regulator
MDLNQELPAYITEKKNIIRLIIFTAAFALIFINIYSPFEVNTGIANGAKILFKTANPDLLLLISSSFIILTGVLVVVVSRIILYQVTKWRGSIKLGQFFLWIAAEVFSMSTFYAIYEIRLLDDPRPFWDAYKVSIQNTALVLLLPYSISWLYFSWTDKNRMLQQLKEAGETQDMKDMIVFSDEKGTMRLTLKFIDLLYLQAADNYVNIVYSNKDKISKYMLRSSLKLIEDEHKGFPLIRCHRSFMVNFDKVKIIRREKDGLRIELDSPVLIEIPVSKTYLEDVFKAFGHTLS